MRTKITASAVLAVAVAGIATWGAAATPTSGGAARISCKNGVTLGVMAPITGPAASMGADQLHWSEFFVSQWNASHKLKINLVQGDTQLDPSKASTVAQQFASNSKLMGLVGPSGSSEVTTVASTFKRSHLVFISPSATNVSLTNGEWRGYFFRVVPNDSVQGPSDAAFMTRSLGVSRGASVMIVDDQESYSTGLADIVQKALAAKGAKVGRESISQKDTDFSSLIAKASSSTKIVFAPFQLATQTQLLAQQLRAQGKTTPVFASDGSFDALKFNVSGSYVSFFAPDVSTIKADAKIVAAFHKKFPGATSPFGAPTYVATQVLASAAEKVCKSGSISRDAMRKAVATTRISSSILGQPISFTRAGDLAHARFHTFKVVSGKYTTVK